MGILAFSHESLVRFSTFLTILATAKDFRPKKIGVAPILIRSRYCAFKSTFKVVLYVFWLVSDIANLNPYYGTHKLRLVPTVRKA